MGRPFVIPRKRGMRWAEAGKGDLREYMAFRRERAIRPIGDISDSLRRYHFQENFWGNTIDTSKWTITGTVASLDDINGIASMTVSSGTTTSRLNQANIRQLRYALNAEVEFRLKAQDLTQRRIRIGLIGGTTTQDFIIFENDASGSAVTWTAKSNKAGTTTTVDTGYTATTAFTYFRIVCNNAAGQVEFFTRADEKSSYVRQATITTNIPDVRLQVYWEMVNNDTATHKSFVDVVDWWSNPNTELSGNDGIVFRDEKHALDEAGAGTITVTKPTGTLANDFMEMAIHINTGLLPLTVPAGWTLDKTLGVASSTRTLSVYYKVAGTAEPANYTVTYAALPGIDATQVSIRSYGGGDPVTPVDVSSIVDSGLGTDHATTSVNTSYDNDMLITTFVNTNATAAPTWTPPSGESERMDYSSGFINFFYASMSGADEVQAVSGLTGTKTATVTQAGQGIAHILALRPA